MSKPSILVVDDDESIRGYLSTLLAGSGHEVAAVGSGEEALNRLSAGLAPAVVLLDLVLPGMGGLEILERIKQEHPATAVVILSTVGQIRTVVEAMSRGASDYLTKPFQDPELELAIENAMEKQQLREEVRTLRRRLDQFREPPDLVSSHPSMLRIKEIARQVADTDAPVLILGETGVGKEVVARYIHAQSARRDKAFVKVNCAALPHELLESELFGYERGAFSGALKDKPGKFELAHKGTILLDEIGEMSPHLQAKLLHVLQDGEFSRLGARQSMRVDSRVLATTNRALDRAVAEGAFREDLYFRLNVIQIQVPPLRERPDDIPLLATSFIERYREKDAAPRPIPPKLIEAFLAHTWPGNVRELENAVRRYLILSDPEMALADLRRPAREAGTAAAPQPPAEVSLKALSARAAEQAEQEAVRRALSETRWNRRQAARKLNISYKALLNKLKKWEVRPSSEAPTDPPAETKAARRA